MNSKKQCSLKEKRRTRQRAQSEPRPVPRPIGGASEAKYREINKWCRRTDSNCRPLHYQWSALPLSYGGAGYMTNRSKPARYCHRSNRYARPNAKPLAIHAISVKLIGSRQILPNTSNIAFMRKNNGKTFTKSDPGRKTGAKTA